MGQAFFTHMAEGQSTASLTFRNSQRLTQPDPTPFQRITETRPLLTLQGAGSTLTDEAYVYFEPGASDGYESAYDALKLPNPTGLNLTSSVASGQSLAIDGRAPLGTTQRVVPLTVGVPTAGRYTLSVVQLLNLNDTFVYLHDVLNGTFIDLGQQSSYPFTVSNAAVLLQGRFELVFSPRQALATVAASLSQQVALYPNPAKTSAFVELPAGLGHRAVVATLVDAVGRQVRTMVLPAQGAGAHALDLRELPTGIYALRLETSAGLLVKRLTVE